MGIPKFNAWLSSDQLFRTITGYRLPTNVNILAIDMNSIIHQSAQKIYGYGDKSVPPANLAITEISQQMVFQDVCQKILELTQQVHPNLSLILAVDGVPPQAKILQQRGRRYESAVNRKPDQVFDSNAINPGTEFMRELDQYLSIWLDDNASRLPPHVYYSGHTVPGEGEHKIADYIRNLPQKTSNICIHGNDSDLFMIYLLQMNHSWNIYLYREQDKPRKNIVVNLRDLAKIVTRLYTGVPHPLDDFVVLLFLNGNDFLPHFPIFELTSLALPTLIYGYVEFIRSHPGESICSGSIIEWKTLGRFCDYISSNYYEILLNAWGLNQTGAIKFQSKVFESCLNMYHQIKGSKTSCVHEIDLQMFKTRWYQNAFSPEMLISPDETDISKMLTNYLEGIIWVYIYYKYGSSRVNVGWFYAYHYTPDFSDLGPFIANQTVSWISEPIYLVSEFCSQLEQMLQVMPPKSIDLLPEQVQILMSVQSPIIDLYPNQFISDTQGKQESWQAVPIIPIPDSDRVKKAIGILNLPENFLQKYSTGQVKYIEDIERSYRKRR